MIVGFTGTQKGMTADQRKAYFASAVMLGAASEKTIYLLMDALHSSVSDSNEKIRIKSSIDRRTLPTMFTCISDNLERGKATKIIPYSVYEGADRHLLSFQEMIRVQRNEAVHPVLARITHQSLRLSLSVFPAACRKVYDLIEWLNKNHL